MLWLIFFAVCLPVLAVVFDGIYTVLYAKVKETVRNMKGTVSHNNSAAIERIDLSEECVKKAS